jgi:hypothetical protein
VANALLVRGSLTFGGAVFLLHSSVEAAMAAALSLPEEDAPLTPHRPRVTSRPSPRDGVNGWRRAQGGSSTRGVPFVRQRIPRIRAPNLPPLLPLPGVDTSACQPARAPREPATGFTPPHPPAHTPYLAAVLKPAASPPPTTRKTLPPLPASGFFRCHSPDHNVKDCRDPVRCRRCRGSGHRQHRCKMPVNRVLAPWPRRGALSTPLTGSVSPSSPRSASAPPRPSPSPPPRSPPPRQRRSASLAPGLWRPSTSAPGTLFVPRAGSRRRKGLRRGQPSSRARWTFTVLAFRLRPAPRRRLPPRQAGARLLRLPLQPLLLRRAAPRPAA